MDTVKEKGGKPDRKPYPLVPTDEEIQTETLSMRTPNAQKSQRNCRFINSASIHT
jgi:hypothetical protein